MFDFSPSFRRTTLTRQDPRYVAYLPHRARSGWEPKKTESPIIIYNHRVFLGIFSHLFLVNGLLRPSCRGGRTVSRDLKNGCATGCVVVRRCHVLPAPKSNTVIYLIARHDSDCVTDRLLPACYYLNMVVNVL